MKILILSKEAWRDEQNGGNVLSNIFSSFKDSEFAQVYCTDAEPNNSICKKYFQFTDKMMVDSFLHWKKAGTFRLYKDFPISTSKTVESYQTFKRFGEMIRVAREVVWKLGRWDIEGLLNFVTDFNPDVIFAPCYGSHYMIRITKLVKEHLKKPIISYISDDFYSNNQLFLNPIIWINHQLLRKNVRSVFRIYDLVYTMTEEQKVQCEREFHANMKILCKNGNFSLVNEKKKVNSPIRLVYGGGIYINRWKTLLALTNAIKIINCNGRKLFLDIYTNTYLDKSILEQLNDGVNVNLYPSVSMNELRQIYKESDIALHCEAFDKKSRKIVQLSFSTKIVDCLDSGCAVMAICSPEQAGFAYLRRNDAAICIDEIGKILPVLESIISNPEILITYQKKAFELGRKNHLEKNITAMLKDDFIHVISKSK